LQTVDNNQAKTKNPFFFHFPRPSPKIALHTSISDNLSRISTQSRISNNLAHESQKHNLRTKSTRHRFCVIRMLSSSGGRHATIEAPSVVASGTVIGRPSTAHIRAAKPPPPPAHTLRSLHLLLPSPWRPSWRPQRSLEPPHEACTEGTRRGQKRDTNGQRASQKRGNGGLRVARAWVVVVGAAGTGIARDSGVEASSSSSRSRSRGRRGPV